MNPSDEARHLQERIVLLERQLAEVILEETARTYSIADCVEELRIGNQTV